MNDGPVNDGRLTLLGQSTEDLPAISALLQDATLRIEDIAFDRRGRRLVLLVNRYRWEQPVPSRARAALRIETVGAVQRQNWPRGGDAVLDLLSVEAEGEFVQFRFAGGAGLRAKVEVVDLVLEDLAAPWPTDKVPRHSV